MRKLRWDEKALAVILGLIVLLIVMWFLSPDGNPLRNWVNGIEGI